MTKIQGYNLFFILLYIYSIVVEDMSIQYTSNLKIKKFVKFNLIIFNKRIPNKPLRRTCKNTLVWSQTLSDLNSRQQELNIRLLLFVYRSKNFDPHFIIPKWLRIVIVYSLSFLTLPFIGGNNHLLVLGTDYREKSLDIFIVTTFNTILGLEFQDLLKDPFVKRITLTSYLLVKVTPRTINKQEVYFLCGIIIIDCRQSWIGSRTVTSYIQSVRTNQL